MKHRLTRRSLLVAPLAMVWACRRPAPVPSSGRLWHLTPGAEACDWRLLDPWQGVISRSDFVRLMDEVYSDGGSWAECFTMEPGAVLIRQSSARPQALPPYRLTFATGASGRGTRYWRKPAELPPLVEAARPLADLRIALDPGHIGGAWADMEERNFNSVKEGELTLQTARVLATLLEEQGAQVSLVRDALRPLTEPDWPALRTEARRALEIRNTQASTAEVEKEAQRLFYRTAEIRQRAHRVNQQLRPDLTVCLHYNAGAVYENHLHILAHGCLSRAEMAYDDQRLEAMLRLCQRCSDVELDLCVAVADGLAHHTGLPAFTSYGQNARSHRQSPFVWIRNLIANRLYQCPVVFCEPYVMNNPEVAARVAMGDYVGESQVYGKMRPSIFREYAHGVVAGLCRYYLSKRTSSA